MSHLRHFEPIAEAVATMFHPYVEVVLHDTRSNRVAAIFNCFSKRKVGDKSYLENLEDLADGPSVHGPFEKRGIDGRRIKYMSSLLRNDQGDVVGMMCINVNVHIFDQIAGALQLFLRTENSATLDAHFNDDWLSRINVFVHDYLQENGLTLQRLAKPQRLAIIRALKEAGAFRAKNAANHTANVLGISRATVYNDLARLEGES